MRYEEGKYKNEQIPICKECNWHAEMQHGTWNMCKHQREEDELIEATKFTIGHVKQDYVQSWSHSYRMTNGGLTEYRTHDKLDDPEQDGLFCDWCGRTGIGEEPIEHAMQCMRTPGWEKKQTKRLCELCKKDINNLPGARTNCGECDDKMYNAFLEPEEEQRTKALQGQTIPRCAICGGIITRDNFNESQGTLIHQKCPQPEEDDHHPEEEEHDEGPPPEYYEEHYDRPGDGPPPEYYEEQEPPPDYGHDEPEEGPPHDEGGY